MKRVFMTFRVVQAWHCEFWEEDKKNRLPRTVILRSDAKVFELAKRGGYTLDIAGRQAIETALRKKQGGLWLELNPEQYKKLQ